MNVPQVFLDVALSYSKEIQTYIKTHHVGNLYNAAFSFVLIAAGVDNLVRGHFRQAADSIGTGAIFAFGAFSFHPLPAILGTLFWGVGTVKELRTTPRDYPFIMCLLAIPAASIYLNGDLSGFSFSLINTA